MIYQEQAITKQNMQ